VPPELMLAAGLVKPSDKGRAPYDVFRNRIIFPIRDARGRCIAFGGRAMDPSTARNTSTRPRPSSSTRAGACSTTARARGGRQRAPLIVAEGYMDVIALSEAGFPAAVAPSAPRSRPTSWSFSGASTPNRSWRSTATGRGSTPRCG
jgi:DNA primase